MASKPAFMVNPDAVTPFDALFHSAEAKHGFLLGTLKTLAGVESRGHFNTKAISPKGAAGLMQVLPGNYKAYGYTDADMQDPAKNIEAASRVYKDAMKLYPNNPHAQFAYYNGGKTQGDAVAAGKLASALETREYLRMASPFLNKVNPDYSFKLATSVGNLELAPNKGGNNNFDWQTPDPFVASEQKRAIAREAADRYSNEPGSSTADAFRLGNSALAWLDNKKTEIGHVLDTDFRLTDEQFKVLAQQYGAHGAAWLADNAMSPAHLSSLQGLFEERQRLQQYQDTLNPIARFALGMGAAMLSPENLAMMPIGGGLGMLSSSKSVWNASRVAKMLDTGVTQGALAVASDGILSSLTGHETDPQMSFAGGMVLGSLAGALSRLPPEARELEKVFAKTDDAMVLSEAKTLGSQIPDAALAQNAILTAQHKQRQRLFPEHSPLDDWKMARQPTLEQWARDTFPDKPPQSEALPKPVTSSLNSAYTLINRLKQSHNPLIRTVSERIQKALPTDVPIQIKTNSMKPSAYYDASQHMLVVSHKALQSDTTMTHELVHAATSWKLHAVEAGVFVGKKVHKAAEELTQIAQYVRKQAIADGSINQGSHWFATKDAHELLAYALSDNRTAEWLQGYTWKSHNTGSIWSRFVGTIRDLFGIPKNEENAFTRVLELGDSLMKERVDLNIAMPNMHHLAVSLGEGASTHKPIDVVLKSLDDFNLIHPLENPMNPTSSAAAEAMDVAIERGEQPSKAAFHQIGFSVADLLHGSDNIATRQAATRYMPAPQGKLNRMEVQKTTVYDTATHLYYQWRAPGKQAIAQATDLRFKQLGLNSSVKRLMNSERREAQEQLFREVIAYAESPVKPPDVPQEVKLLAEGLAKVFDDAVDYINDPGKALGQSGCRRPLTALPLDKSPNYLPVMFDTRKIALMVQKVGLDKTKQALHALVYQGRRALGNEVLIAHNLEYRQVQAKGHAVERIPAGFNEEEWAHKLATDTADAYQDTLMEALLRGDVLNEIDGGAHMGGSNSNLKERLQMNRSITVNIDGQTFSWADFRDTDLGRVVDKYAKRMSFDVAEYAHTGVGNDIEFAQTIVAPIKDAALATSAEGGKRYTTSKMEKELKELQFFRDALRGVPPPMQFGPKLTASLKLMRSYMQSVMSGGFVFAQAAEYAGSIGLFGYRTAMKSIPAYRAFMTDLKTGKYRSQDVQMLAQILGDGTEELSRFDIHDSTAWRSAFGDNAVGRMGDALQAKLSATNAFIADVTQFAPLNQKMRLDSGMMALHDWIDVAVHDKHSRALSPEMQAWAGLTPQDFAGINALLRQHAQMDHNGNLQTLNWDGFRSSNPELFIKFQTAMSRLGEFAVQRNGAHTTNSFLASTLGQTIFQFRSFTLNAHVKQFLRSLHFRDQVLAYQLLYGSVLSSMLYASRVYLYSLGRADAEEYRNRMLDPQMVAGVTFSRQTMAGILPAILASASPVDIPGITAGRTSFVAQDDKNRGSAFFTGMPVVNLLDNLQSTVKSPLQVAASNGEKQLDRIYWRQTLSMLPFSTLLGISNGLNNLIGYAPKRNQTDYGLEQERLRRNEHKRE